MKILDLMEKAHNEKRTIYVVKGTNLYQIFWHGKYATLLYESELDQWKPAQFTTLWLQDNDYMEISQENFKDLLSKQKLF